MSNRRGFDVLDGLPMDEGMDLLTRLEGVAAYRGGVTCLPDGTVGYFMRAPRMDDCWCAAVATCLQVPIREVPDPCIDKKLTAGVRAEEINRSAWVRTERWLKKLGLRMIVHHKVPVPHPRWIGVARGHPGPRGQFADHCLVMTGDEVLFDTLPHLPYFVRLGAPDILWGVSFTKTRKRGA